MQTTNSSTSTLVIGEHIISAVRNGDLVLVNDGSVSQLQRVLQVIFPDDSEETIGGWGFYFAQTTNKYKHDLLLWDADDCSYGREQISIKSLFTEVQIRKSITHRSIAIVVCMVVIFMYLFIIVLITFKII